MSLAQGPQRSDAGEARTRELCFMHPVSILKDFRNAASAKMLIYCQTRNIFKKDIQRHSKENIHLKSCCNWKMFFMHKRLVLDVD